ncbi:hypothetical protein HAX54_012572, partial [Datura stramonium]|nr:hypothetical protein [Datura stramonium]
GARASQSTKLLDPLSWRQWPAPRASQGANGTVPRASESASGFGAVAGGIPCRLASVHWPRMRLNLDQSDQRLLCTRRTLVYISSSRVRLEKFVSFHGGVTSPHRNIHR